MKPQRLVFTFTLFVLFAWLGAASPSALAACEPVFAAPTTIWDFGAGNDRPFGIAAADFDEDGSLDLVAGRYTGNVYFLKGNGDGAFQAPVAYAWKQAFFNAWALVAADVNGDNHFDIVWGANATSPSSGTPVVNDGEIRYFQGNGDGTFVENLYTVSGVVHNAGMLIADIGTDAGSLAAGDIDGDLDIDLVAGGVDGSNSVVRILRNTGGAFTVETVVSQASATAPGSPIYYPASSPQNSPWGLAFGDADGDGDADLWIGDRALFVYLYANNGSGTFSLVAPNPGSPPGRTNAYLAHEAYRAAVGYTPSLGAADINNDGKVDLFVGLHSGAQTPASAVAHDGELLLDASTATAHALFGVLADLGTVTRGVTVADVDRDGQNDVIAGIYEGRLRLIRGLPPDASPCGDGNPCTIDECVGGACANPPAPDGTDCDDGSVCTAQDACVAGICIGAPIACDDGNVCTDDSCDPASGQCVSTPVAGRACGDPSDTVCDDPDSCDGAGGCLPNHAPTSTLCREDAGLCDLPEFCNPDGLCPDDAFEPAGTACGDPSDTVCDDPDSCDGAGGCLPNHAPAGASCSDDNACTLDDLCSGTGGCIAGPPRPCDDGNPCTDDACDPASGCYYLPDDANACNDGNACTADSCVSGSCTGSPIVCDDSNPCTDDGCEPASGCVFVPDDTNGCTDANACTSDLCSAGRCVSTVIVCDDLNPCTDDSCDPASGCFHTPDDANACSDGNACTTQDRCLAAACVGGPPPNCNDGNTCTDDSCDPAAGCVNTNNNGCEGNVKGPGYWARLCRGPHPSGEFLSAWDVECVNDTCTFASVTSPAELCARLTGPAPSDKCGQAEGQLMTLLLNTCRHRVGHVQPIDASCGPATSVGQAIADADGVLCDPARDAQSCNLAHCGASEINTGEALWANSLRLERVPGGALRLTWDAPYSGPAGQARSLARRYRIWTREGSEAAFVLLGETDGSPLTYVAGGAGVQIQQFEVTAVW